MFPIVYIYSFYLTNIGVAITNVAVRHVDKVETISIVDDRKTIDTMTITVAKEILIEIVVADLVAVVVVVAAVVEVDLMVNKILFSVWKKNVFFFEIMKNIFRSWTKSRSIR